MITRTIDDPILARFRAALDRLYGDRIEHVVLFGSRARGDAQPDSDYDIAVFLWNPGSFWQEMGPLADNRGTNPLRHRRGHFRQALPRRRMA